MNVSRGFLHITYKLYHHLDLVDGERKSHCLNVFLSVMKYAWKKNGYKAGLRHETIHKDTGLCRTTIKSCLETLNKLNIVKSVRGRSGKTYLVNETFLRAEKLYEPTQIAVKPTQDSRFTATLEETLSINNIGKIVKSFAGDTEKILDELSKLPLDELKAETVNVYLCKQAIQRKEDKERESKATYVNADKILSALSKIKKQANPRYREKVEYNKRNGIKPWENK
ncbi:putative transcriptional regulator [Pelagibacter phage HTVC024P]|nr:putative transcriptional regulator [Pelagibacter phage HTVC024P]